MAVSSLPDILADHENGKAEIQSPVIILKRKKIAKSPSETKTKTATSYPDNTPKKIKNLDRMKQKL